MKKFKPAFTLIETLIAMAIIGVIAAVTIPQVVKNMNKSQTGIVLARAVEQINLGCQNMIQMANDQEEFSFHDRLSTITGESLGDTSENKDKSIMRMVVNTYFKTLAESFWGIAPNHLKDVGLNNIVDIDGDDSFNDVVECLDKFSNFCRNFKDIPASIILTSRAFKVDNLAQSDLIPGTFIIIDTNTFAKQPNIIGKDLFVFELQNSGKLIPAEKYTRQIIKDGYKIKYY